MRQNPETGAHLSNCDCQHCTYHRTRIVNDPKSSNLDRTYAAQSQRRADNPERWWWDESHRK